MKAAAEDISKAIAHNTTKHLQGKRNIIFVRASEQPRSQPKPAAGLLTSASDWELRGDLGKQLKFLDHVITTSLRPNIVLTSVSARQVLMIELTVPWEDRIERKRSKYQELVEQCRGRGWKARWEPIEVGVEALLAAHCATFTHCSASRGLRRGMT